MYQFSTVRFLTVAVLKLIYLHLYPGKVSILNEPL